MFSIDVRSAGTALAEIELALRRAFPRAGILAVGLGRRRHERQRGTPLVAESVLKLVLREKLRPLPKRLKRLPRRIAVHVPVLGRTVRVVLATDIEQSTLAQPTRYRIGPLPSGSLCLASYARWSEQDVVRLGGITAGHGLWKSASDATPLAKATLDFGDGTTLQARVRWASHLARDGLDAALLAVDPADQPVLHAEARSFFAQEPVLPGPSELEHLLGGATDALELASEFRHFDHHRTKLESVAYYPKRTIDVAGWGECTLRGAIESEGPVDSFTAGTSGSGVVSRPPRRALGIQSLCLDAGAPAAGHNRRGLSTSFEAALAAIRAATGLAVTPYWVT